MILYHVSYKRQIPYNEVKIMDNPKPLTSSQISRTLAQVRAIHQKNESPDIQSGLSSEGDFY